MNKHILSGILSATLLVTLTNHAGAEGTKMQIVIPSPSINETTPFGVQSSTLINQKVEKTLLDLLKEEQTSLATRLFSTEFSAIPLEEQLTLLTRSFAIQTEIHNEYKKDLLTSQMTNDMDNLKKQLRAEEILLDKEMQLLEQMITLVKSSKKYSLNKYESNVKDTLTFLKQARSSGKEVYELVNSKNKTLQANQISLLQQVVTSSIKENRMEQAREALTKIVEISEGDSDYLALLMELLDGNKSYLLSNNELNQLEGRYMKIENEYYIPFDDIGKWMNVSVKTDAEGREVIVINHLEQEVAFMRKEVFVEQVSIGTPSVWKSDDKGKAYINAEFLFELFGYNLSTVSENMLKIDTPIYPLTEIDQLPVNDLVRSIING